VWVAAVVGILALGVVLLWLAFWAARRVDARYEKRAALVARAPQFVQFRGGFLTSDSVA
jgi:NhaP-type Na+/H+ or K+/H+ antiporter